MSQRQTIPDSWKIFRIIGEFVDGFETMSNIGPAVTVFGSARALETHPHYAIAEKLTFDLAKKGFAIITGAGPGMMQAANQGAQRAGGISCGVGVDLPFESENPFVDRKYRLSFRYFFVRKVMFLKYSQAFIFLPGGIGTLDELFEVMTLIQTKKAKQVPIFLVGVEFWQGLIQWLQTSPLKQKFIELHDLNLFTVTDDCDSIVQSIAAAPPISPNPVF